MTNVYHCSPCNADFVTDQPGPPYSAHHEMDGDGHHVYGDPGCRVEITAADLPPMSVSRLVAEFMATHDELLRRLAKK